MADEVMKKLDLADYSKMKELLTLQLLSADGNGYKLEDVPYRKVEDMTLVYRFDLGDTENGRASILVTNDMLRRYGINAEQLHQDAMAATVNNRPASLRNMEDVLTGVEMDSSPLWVASVDGGMNGACVIQYPGFLDQAAKTLGGDFFVLPIRPRWHRLTGFRILSITMTAESGSLKMPEALRPEKNPEKRPRVTIWKIHPP